MAQFGAPPKSDFPVLTPRPQGYEFVCTDVQEVPNDSGQYKYDPTKDEPPRFQTYVHEPKPRDSVMEALKERGLMLQNAPHLVLNLGFVVPNYDWWEAPFYGIGLKLYNLLAGKYKFGPSRVLSREETLQQLPSIRTEGLRGGVIYYDGQFDDSRLLVNLVTTAFEPAVRLTAIHAASIGSVPEPHIGSAKVLSGFQRLRSTSAAASVSFKGASPACSRYPLLWRPGPVVSRVIVAISFKSAISI